MSTVLRHVLFLIRFPKRFAIKVIKRVQNSVLLDFDGSSHSFNSMKAGSQMLNEKYQSFTIILDFCIASLS